MPTQKELDRVFLNIAKEVATLSYCQRSKVGAVIEKDGNLISFGYNGMPSKMDNCCENKKYKVEDSSSWLDTEELDEIWPYVDNNGNRYTLETKQEVLHAESNSILKAAKTGHAVNGATLFLTLSPCLECCKLIIQSGIKRIVYLENYRSLDGVNFLKQFIIVEQYDTSI